MAGKDPAFLMYSKDWIEGTAEYMPDEKGIYIDLLCYQHQKGSLPNDIKRLSRLVRLSEDEFIKIWDIISEKFEQIDDRLVNQKLNRVMTERSIKGKKNTITGTFAALLRKSNLSKKDYNYVRSCFNVSDFEHLERERITERLTEWYKECLKSIANANANANEDNNIKVFFESFKKITNKKLRVIDEKTERQFNARIKEGYTIDEILEATQNCKNDKYHIENPKFLTPEFITRSDKLQKYLNSDGSHSSSEKQTVNLGKNTHTYKGMMKKGHENGR
jgi:uncharacterized phage protein (TIGR02220 family)